MYGVRVLGKVEARELQQQQSDGQPSHVRRESSEVSRALALGASTAD